MKQLSPVTFDGIIYAVIALCGFLGTELGTDEAIKYVSPQALFWIKMLVGGLGATFLAVKMYRSTTFADYKQAKNGTYHTGDTQTLTKNDIPPTTPKP